VTRPGFSIAGATERNDAPIAPPIPIPIIGFRDMTDFIYFPTVTYANPSELDAINPNGPSHSYRDKKRNQ
jgi:hypothetical protein